MKKLGLFFLFVCALATADDITNLSRLRVGLSAVSDDAGRIYVLGGEASGGAATLERLDPQSGKWEVLAAPPAKRYFGAAVVVEGKIYVLGGEKDFKNSMRYATDVLAYDIATNAWSNVGKLAGRRRDLAAAAVGSHIYSVGGTAVVYGGDPAPAIIPDPSKHWLDAYGVRYSETFDTKVRKSSVIAPVPRRRTQHAVAAGKDGKIYAIGGWFQGDFYGYPDHGLEVGVTYLNKSVEVYDPSADEWFKLVEMPTPRFGLTALTGADGRLYTIGGQGAKGVFDGNLEVLDPATAKWTKLKSMPTPVKHHGSALGKDGRIWVLGGEDKHGRVRGLVQVYDPAKDAWEQSVEKLNPDEETDFATLVKDFETKGTLPDKAKLNGWWVGRCFDRNSSVALAGLLVAYGEGKDLKVTTLKSESASDKDWFDELDGEKGETIDKILKQQDPNLKPAREIEGSLVSTYTRKGEFKNYVYEYQVKQLGERYISRVVNVTDEGKITAACIHSKKAAH